VEPIRYGTVKNLASFNLLTNVFHEWIGMAKDVARHPRHALGYVFGPPGWSHDGSRDTSRTLKAKWRARTARREGQGPTGRGDEAGANKGS
jgi:hypothetical protein